MPSLSSLVIYLHLQYECSTTNNNLIILADFWFLIVMGISYLFSSHVGHPVV